MRTVGRHHPVTAPRGEYTATCDLCGVLWHRSKMRRRRDGTLVCPDDSRERDAVTLSEGNAMGVDDAATVRSGGDGGGTETQDLSTATAVHYNSAADWP